MLRNLDFFEPSSLRCAAWAREAGVDPIGTAGSYEGFLLIEWPLPWPRDLGEVPALAPLHNAMAGTGLRLQGLVPLLGDEARRAICYTRRRGNGFAGYQCEEVVVPVDGLLEAAIALVRGGVGSPERDRAGITNDLLLCTHGKRDVCCGAQGMALCKTLSGESEAWAGAVRLWRTSHTGGHRFAPTVIVLPQGTAWAFMDGDALRRIVAQAGPLEDLLPRYRGCSGIGPRAVQAVEREAFREIGWGWLDWRRWGEAIGNGRVRLTGESPSGERRTWEAIVEVTRMVPVPECGLPVESATKSEPELVVSDICSA